MISKQTITVFIFSAKSQNVENLKKYWEIMAGSEQMAEGMTWLYDPNSAKPKDEDFLLGKAVDTNFEQRGTMGQINAVEYGKVSFKNNSN